MAKQNTRPSADWLQHRFDQLVAALRAAETTGVDLDERLRPGALLYLVRHLEHNLLLPLLGREAVATIPWRDGHFQRGDVLSPAEGYNRLAEVYDSYLVAGVDWREDDAMLRPAIGDVRGLTVLDVGCGTGRHAVAFAREGAARVTGVDVAERMIAVARQRAADEAPTGSFDWHVGDVLHLPLEPASLDLVFSSLAISHIADLAAFFRHIAAALKPRGRVVLHDIHPCSQMVGTVAGLPQGNDWVQMELHTHPLSSYFAAAPPAGLTVTNIREHSLEWVLPMLVCIELRKD